MFVAVEGTPGIRSKQLLDYWDIYIFVRSAAGKQ